MIIQQHLELLAVQFNLPKLKQLSKLITTDTWTTGLLNKDTLKQLDIKCNSPKLSKVLIEIGLSNEVVSNIFSGQFKSQLSRAKITNIVNSEADILNQSNSIYFTSCQTTNSSLKEYISSYSDGVQEDLEISKKNELFLWVVGENYDVDKRGFISRAKLRTMYFDEECTKIAGLFVEHMYGTVSLLRDNSNELELWWNEYCYTRWGTNTPIYEYGDDIKLNVYVPSSKYGYQDTFDDDCDTFKLLKQTNGTLIKSAYKSRKKEKGVYNVSLKSVKYNPQNYQISVQESETKKWRGIIDEKDRKVFNYIHQLLKGKFCNIKVSKWSWCREYKFGNYEIFIDDDGLRVKDIYYYNRVTTTNKELGFYEAEDLPIFRDKWNDAFVVQRDMPEIGYMMAERLPELWYELYEGGWKIGYPNDAQKELGYARAINI